VIGVLALGLGIVELVAPPVRRYRGRSGPRSRRDLAAVVIAVLVFFSRRKQRKLQAERDARAPG
jgi:hypothetical protein